MSVADNSRIPPEARPKASFRDVPWTVKAFCVVYVAGSVATGVTQNNVVRISILPGVAISLLIAIGVFLRYRGAWGVAMFFAVLGFIGSYSLVRALIAGTSNDVTRDLTSVVFWAISTGLLLHPATRR